MCNAIELDEVLKVLNRSHRLDFTGYRRSFLMRRVKHRAACLGCSDLRQYLAVLCASAGEGDRLIDTFLITVSTFFRNPAMFDTLAQTVVPELMERKRFDGNTELRAWCAGCATGEESYSLTMLLNEIQEEEQDKWKIHVFASDIDKAALEKAMHGLYGRDKLANVTLGMLDRYFTAARGCYQVNPAIREMVRFSWHDLTALESLAPPDSIYGAFDLVLCRNVLIYFSKELQEAVFEKLFRVLAKGGYLILGESETISERYRHKMKTIDARNRIYQKYEY